MVVKSHRQLRHEREHNELADWLEERLEALRPYTAQLAVAAILIAVAVAAGVYYFNTENQLASQEWAEYFDAFNEREPQKALQELNAAKPESPAGLWAAQTLGDINLAQGAAQLFLDREQATEKLEAAKGFYQKAEAAKGDQNLVARARLGLGKVHEAMCQPEEALKYYKLVADDQKGTALGAAAEKAVQRMENPRTVEMLAWFATQTPKKPSPLPGAGGGLPGLPNDLPEKPDISPPLGLGLDDLGSGIPAGPDLSLPQPGTAPPPEPKPGDEPRPAEPKPEDAKTEPNADAKSLESPTSGTPE